MTPLCEILTRHGSDKSRDGGHSYGPVYHALFEPRRQEIKSVLEIGVQWGASLKAWAEYFPFAEVVGLDISSDLWSGPRYRSYRCDSTDAQQASDTLGIWTFDVIIDDGSHWVEDQVKTWDVMKHRLNPGGIYVVEDIQHLEHAEPFASQGFTVHDLRSARGRFDDILAVYVNRVKNGPVRQSEPV